MIVVIGSPVAQLDGRGSGAAGLAPQIARAASAAGGDVQLVGRIGEDAPGDAILLALAADRVGHVAVLREPSRPTPTESPAAHAATAGPEPEPEPKPELELGAALTLDDDGPTDASVDGLALDAADLDLALRYLPDYRVVIVACDLDDRGRATVAGAVGWAGAHLVAIVSDAADAAGLPPDATVLDRPARDGEGALAAVVAAYAVALDRGVEPAAAFAEAAAGGGWAASAKPAEAEPARAEPAGAEP